MSKQAFLSFFLVLSSLMGLEAGALRDKGPEYSQLSEQFTWFSNVRQSRKAGRTIIESGQKLPQPLNLSQYSHPGSECVSPSTCPDHACPPNCTKPCCVKKCDMPKCDQSMKCDKPKCDMPKCDQSMKCDKPKCDMPKCDDLSMKCDKPKCDMPKCDDLNMKCDKPKCDMPKCDKPKCEKTMSDKPKACPPECVKPCCVKEPTPLSEYPKAHVESNSFKSKMNTSKESTQTFFRHVGKFFKSDD